MRRGKRNGILTSATKLSEMGVCERKIWLRAKYGDRAKSEARVVSMNRGTNIHSAAEKGNYREVKGDSRCFIATCIYGNTAPETMQLREFRDKYLMTSFLGKAFVYTYYATSPTFVRLIKKSEHLRKFTSWWLGHVVSMVNKLGANS